MSHIREIAQRVPNGPLRRLRDIQRQSVPGSIWITRSTQALINDQISATKLGAIRLKGIVDEVQAYNVGFDPHGDQETYPAKQDQTHDLADQLQNIDVNALSTQERDELLRTMSKLLDR